MRPSRRRAIRIFLTTVLGLVALVALLLGFLATPPGRAVLARTIESLASSDDLALSIDSLSGWPPFYVGADHVALSDRNGVFATVDGMAVDIDFWALFAGQVRAESFAASRVAVARLPVFAERGDEESDGALFPLPVDRVSMQRLDLGAELVGSPVSLTVAGDLTVESDGGLTASLEGERIDGKSGTFAARVSREDGSSPLLAHIEASEAADGLLAGAMGRSNAPAYRLVADSDLVKGVWQGKLSLTSEGDARFAGTFAVSGVTGPTRHFSLSGKGDIDSLVPPAYAGLLAGPITLDIDADWNTESGAALPALTIRKGTVRTAAIDAQASGTFGGPATDLDLAIEIADPAGDPVTLPLSGESVRVTSLALNGGANTVDGVMRLELTGRITGLDTDAADVPNLGLSLALEADGEDPLADSEWPFGLRLRADAIETADGRIAATDAEPIAANAQGVLYPEDLSAELTAEIALAGNLVNLSGTASSEAANADVDATVTNLAALAPLVGNGAVSAAERLLVGETRVTTTVASGFDGNFTLSDLVVENVATSLSGDLALAPETMEGAFEGTIADLSRLAPQSSGAATFTAEISGALARPTLEATLKMAEGQLFERAVEDATISVTGAPTDDGWSGALTLDGAYAGRPLAGGAELSFNPANGVLTVPDIDLSIGENRIAGSLIRGEAGLFDGTLTVDAPDIQSLAALALTEATGRAEAEIRLSSADNSQSADVSFSGADIAVAAVTAGEIEGQLQITNSFSEPLVRGTSDASDVVVGSLRFDNASLSATVEDGATRFQGEADGEDLDLSTVGRLAGQTLSIESLSGTAFRLPLEIAETVTISFNEGDTRLTGGALNLGGGRVSAAGQVLPQLDLAVQFSNIAASTADRFAPALGAQGTISGQATITGTPASPEIDWQADWNGLSVASTRSAGLPALSLSAEGKAGAARTTIDATLSGAGLSLDINGTVPFSGGSLDLDVSGSAPLALASLAMTRETRLAGTATLNMAVSGTPASPSISGTIDLAEAMLADPDTGFGIAGASGRIRLDGRTARVENLSGRLTQGGQITVSGSVGIDPAANFPADLSIRISDGRYSDGSMMNAAFSSQLAISGPLLGAGTISGRLDLGRTEILLPERLGGSATAIDVEHVNEGPAFESPLPTDTSGPSRDSDGGGGGLRLDIEVASNSSILVRGFGLDAELGGSVRLAGTVGSPQSVGAFDLIRGRITVLGRRFEFTDGRMIFSGDLIPLLDFHANTSTSGGTVTVSVTGPANEPEISFTSSSGLPEEEVLAQLLFDRDLGQLSPLQAVQLLDAVAQLSGAVRRGGGLFDRIRQATGLDDLDIRQNEEGDTTVGLGRRINENLRLGVEGDTGSGGGRVTIDLDLTRDLKLRGSAGDGSGKVGITYEHEY